MYFCDQKPDATNDGLASQATPAWAPLGTLRPSGKCISGNYEKPMALGGTAAGLRELEDKTALMCTFQC